MIKIKSCVLVSKIIKFEEIINHEGVYHLIKILNNSQR